ncbi:helix-turn-helix domain-containing protein [Aureimonas endophytica]|uniref:helix-turn-helix domain-containing protein n=1 Tax=Aureimonas endophytica TaxID=2027858 RepID=UPI0035710B9C
MDLDRKKKRNYSASLGDLSLDPGLVAAVCNVSLRRLQELLSEEGHSISDWIWERRLVRASTMLRDSTFVDRRISNVAFARGFVNHTHFSSRSKARFGVSPRGFRARETQAVTGGWRSGCPHKQLA